MISHIAAVSKNRVIGHQGDLPWKIPEDLKYFKARTLNKCIIMGRKTFESIGKPLPNRTTIVISRQADLQIEGAIIAHSVEEAILKAKSITREDIFIVGGAEIYALSLPLADQILVTQLHDIFEGDAYFPEIPSDIFEISERERGVTDEKNAYQFSYITYKRK